MSLWYSFHIAMYFNILFSGGCLYIYKIYNVCMSYVSCTRKNHGIIFRIHALSLGAVPYQRNGYHGTGRWQCTPCTLWICGTHPAEASLAKGNSRNKTNWIRTKVWLPNHSFFWGVARSWLFIPRIFFTRRYWWKESFTTEVMIYPFGAWEHEAWWKFLIVFFVAAFQCVFLSSRPGSELLKLLLGWS